jgi:hypothetical protein
MKIRGTPFSWHKGGVWATGTDHESYGSGGVVVHHYWYRYGYFTAYGSVTKAFFSYKPMEEGFEPVKFLTKALCALFILITMVVGLLLMTGVW